MLTDLRDILKTVGPVAQLGARFHGMEEVVSSNLTRSTKFLKLLQPIPYPQLRNRSPSGVQKWTPALRLAAVPSKQYRCQTIVRTDLGARDARPLVKMRPAATLAVL